MSVVYRLDGTIAQTLPIGLINNVDVRQLPDLPFDVAVASHDQINAISVFTVDRSSGEVRHAADLPSGRIEPYGICLGLDDGKHLAAVTYKDGAIDIWHIQATTGGVSGALRTTVKLETQLEGCVFDEDQGLLFVGEEARGLWKIAYREEASAPELIDTIGSGSGLVADVEGVSLWRGFDLNGWIVVSAQAEDRYVVYERAAPHRPVGSFSIGENAAAGIEAVMHTDGLDVSSNILPGYPRGLVIVQDDGNPRKGQDQNFKIIGWAAVEEALSLPVASAD